MRLAARVTDDVPPQAWFLISAVFHYLGPAFAVLLFGQLGPLGVAWLRICSAALVLALFTRPWRTFIKIRASEGRLLVAFGICLAAMNSVFYLALARLPLSLVAAIEFVGTLSLALYGVRSSRNLAALAAAWQAPCSSSGSGGAGTGSGLSSRPPTRCCSSPMSCLASASPRAVPGPALPGWGRRWRLRRWWRCRWASAKRALLGHRRLCSRQPSGWASPLWWYPVDQLALARLPRASFALMLSLLPATATAVGALVLGQVPGLRGLSGIALVVGGVALHRPCPKRAGLAQLLLQELDGPRPGELRRRLVVAGRRGVVVEGVVDALIDVDLVATCRPP